VFICVPYQARSLLINLSPTIYSASTSSPGEWRLEAKVWHVLCDKANSCLFQCHRWCANPLQSCCWNTSLTYQDRSNEHISVILDQCLCECVRDRKSTFVLKSLCMSETKRRPHISCAVRQTCCMILPQPRETAFKNSHEQSLCPQRDEVGCLILQHRAKQNVDHFYFRSN